MVTRRWPDVVIVIAIACLTCAGIWAIWGTELGLRGGGGGKDGPKEPPMERGDGAGAGMT